MFPSPGLQVVEIYRREWKPGANLNPIGRDFGLNPSTVGIIKYRRQIGYREIVDVAKRIGLLVTEKPEPKSPVVEEPMPRSTLFRSHPESNILRHALVRG